jgi:hypothetical protein
MCKAPEPHNDTRECAPELTAATLVHQRDYADRHPFRYRCNTGVRFTGTVARMFSIQRRYGWLVTSGHALDPGWRLACFPTNSG